MLVHQFIFSTAAVRIAGGLCKFKGSCIFFKLLQQFSEKTAASSTSVSTQSTVQKQKSQLFSEKEYMKQFLAYFQNYGSQDLKSQYTLLALLSDNYAQLQKPQSIVAILDKASKFNVYLDPMLQENLIKQASQIFFNNYKVESDQGALLKGIVIVLALNKLSADQFYQKVIPLIVEKQSSISLPNYITILESLTYNRVLLLDFVRVSEICALFENVKGSMTMLENLQFFPQCLNLISYMKKLKQGQFKDPQLSLFFNEVLFNTYNCLLQVFISQQPSLFDPFLISEITNTLNIINKLSVNDQEQQMVHKKYCQYYAHFIKKTLGDVETYDLEKVQRYVKKFLTTPPLQLNTTVANVIHQTFQKAEITSMNDLVPFLYFFSKTMKNFQLPYNYVSFLEKHIPQDKNIFALSKLIEAFAAINVKNDKLIQILEDRIVHLSKYNANPTAALLAMFQSLAALGKGSDTTWNYLLEFFTYPKILQRIDFFELTVKLIPALAIKTKSLYNKGYTNISEDMAVHTFGNVSQPSPLSSGVSQLQKVQQTSTQVQKDQQQSSLESKDQPVSPTSITQAQPYKKKIQSPTPPPEKQMLFVGENNSRLSKNLEFLWDKLELLVLQKFEMIQADKYPTLLFHFIYANFMKKKHRNIYFKLREKVMENLDTYTMRQISEIVYSYARLHEKAPDFFLKCMQIIKARSEELTGVEMLNIYWGYASAKIYAPEFYELLETHIYKKHIKSISTEGLIQFLHSYGMLNRNKEKELDYALVEELLAGKLRSKAITYQQTFGLCYSLLLIDSNKQFARAWQLLLKELLKHTEKFVLSPLFMHHVYLAYVHLKYLCGFAFPELVELDKLIIAHRKTLCAYFKTNKKYQVSKFEQKITSLIDKYQSEIFGVEEQQLFDKKYDVCYKKGWDKPLIFFENLKELDTKDAFPEHEMAIPYTVDKKKGRMCFEMNGPHHYLADQNGKLYLDGASSLKRSFFYAIGLNYIEVPYSVFKGIEEDEVKIKEKLIYLFKSQILPKPKPNK